MSFIGGRFFIVIAWSCVASFTISWELLGNNSLHNYVRLPLESKEHSRISNNSKSERSKPELLPCQRTKCKGWWLEWQVKLIPFLNLGEDFEFTHRRFIPRKGVIGTQWVSPGKPYIRWSRVRPVTLLTPLTRCYEFTKWTDKTHLGHVPDG